MKKVKFLACASVACIVLGLSQGLSAQPSPGSSDDASYRKQYKHAIELYDNGMYERARIEFDRLALESPGVMVEGYVVLCAINMQSEGYDIMADDYELKYPYSPLLMQIRLRYGLVLFDKQDYVTAARLLSYVDPDQVGTRDKAELIYKQAYCDYRNGRTERAVQRFVKVSELKVTDYWAPACFALAYISYDKEDFAEAAEWFIKASGDTRFTEISDYYTIDCKFMLKDYEYVVERGPAVLEASSEERQPHLARMLSESYLVLGQTAEAKQLYDLVLKDSGARNRSDYFFAGSVMYAVQDWQGAIDNFSKMDDRTDSIGQIANYNMAYSYIRTKNKVAAMNSFKAAASQDHDAKIAEDAMFNWAKLAFDLNNDSSVFQDYMKKYPVKGTNDRIYSYIAVASLRNRDYAAAVNAFDKIDELDADMRRNYMKSNFLRASQLIADGSYSDAVPYLKSSAYYAGQGSQLNLLSRYWLAESYYRSGNYTEAKNIYTDLYNLSALDGQVEGALIPFNLAFCYFKNGEYTSAVKWFDVYIDNGGHEYRKGAILRKGDCFFMQRLYDSAAKVYEAVVAEYQNVNDIYPYYQAGVCYGLTGRTAKKIEALLPVKKADPMSKYYSEALYELGRAYVSTDQTEQAKSCFKQLIDSPVDSVYFAKASIEMGMLSRNAKDYDAALGWYKQVVEKMPLSAQADDALAAIESVYETQNKPQEYLAYLNSIGRAGMKSDAEKEQMIFNAAEQLYLAEDYARALQALNEYMETYPNGRNTSDAWFYLAECYAGLGQKEKACDAYSKVVELGSESYLELAMLKFARLSYGLQRYDDAYGGYRGLLENTRMEANKYTAEVGMMRSAYRAHRYDDATNAAATVKADIRSESDMVREADYVTAKSYLQTSRRDEAFAVFETLAKQPKTDEGAEACYLIIQDAYDRGDFTTAINKTFDFSDQSEGRQQYWLAKAFIVLGDCYAEQGELEQAKATFQSIVDAYTETDDDVLENVKLRLEKL